MKPPKMGMNWINNKIKDSLKQNNEQLVARKKNSITHNLSCGFIWLNFISNVRVCICVVCVWKTTFGACLQWKNQHDWKMNEQKKNNH